MPGSLFHYIGNYAQVRIVDNFFGYPKTIDFWGRSGVALWPVEGFESDLLILRLNWL